MKSINKLIGLTRNTLAFAMFVTALKSSIAGSLGPTVDDFSDPKKNNLGIERQFIDDTTTGGKTKVQYQVKDGVLLAKGDLAPPRGQPGWASTIFILDPHGQPQDVSEFEGVRLLIKVNKGNLAISANSTEITNFDYHSAPIVRRNDGKFHEVKIPFAQMKRTWSEQKPLNTKTIASLSLVAADVRQGSFEFEISEISFY